MIILGTGRFLVAGLSLDQPFSSQVGWSGIGGEGPSEGDGARERSRGRRAEFIGRKRECLVRGCQNKRNRRRDNVLDAQVELSISISAFDMHKRRMGVRTAYNWLTLPLIILETSAVPVGWSPWGEQKWRLAP